ASRRKHQARETDQRETCRVGQKARQEGWVEMWEWERRQSCRNVSDGLHAKSGEIEEHHGSGRENHADEGCWELGCEAGNKRDDGERPKRDGERRSLNLTELSDDLQEARNDTTLGQRKAEDLAGLPEDDG